MATLKETAKAYEQKQTKNIADLDSVSVQQEFYRETRQNADGKEYSISFIVVNGIEYRVPNSVLEQIQEIIKAKPNLQVIKVTKKGDGLNTKYTVIQLE